MQTAGRAVVFSGTTVADRPARAHRPAASVPALGRIRGPADPADQRGGSAHAAARRAEQVGHPPGLAACPRRPRGEPLVDRVGAPRRAAAVARRARSFLRARGARARGDEPAAGHLQRQHRRQGRRGQAGPRDARAAGIGSGVLVPAELLVRGSTDPAHVAATLAAVPGVHGAVAPALPTWQHPGVAVVDEFPTPDASTAAGRATLERVQASARALGRRASAVGGIGAQNQDFIDAVYGNFPLMIALIALITFVLLARAFRSLLLPLKAVILNVISVAAAWGVLEIVWQAGHGSSLIWGDLRDGLDHGVDTADGVRLPVRPVDGLRGVHPLPHARGIRRDRLDRHGGRARHRPHRPAGDERRPDPVPRVRVARLRPADRNQSARHGARRRAS